MRLKRSPLVEASIVLLLLVCDSLLVSNTLGLAQSDESTDSGSPWAVSPCSLDDWIILIFLRGVAQAVGVAWLTLSCSSGGPLLISTHFALHAVSFALLIGKVADGRGSSCSDRRLRFILSIVTGACEFVAGLFLWERAARHGLAPQFPGFPDPAASAGTLLQPGFTASSAGLQPAAGAAEPLLEGERHQLSPDAAGSASSDRLDCGARAGGRLRCLLGGIGSPAAGGQQLEPGWDGYTVLLADGTPSAYDTAEDDSFRSAQSELSTPSLSSSVGTGSVLRALTASPPMLLSPPRSLALGADHMDLGGEA